MFNELADFDEFVRFYVYDLLSLVRFRAGVSIAFLYIFFVVFTLYKIIQIIHLVK